MTDDPEVRLADLFADASPIETSEDSATGDEPDQDVALIAPADPVEPGPVATSAHDARVDELTADLQRVHAEYANYRKRVERDRETVRTAAISSVLSELLSVLDDVDRARQHGDLDGAFRAVGDALDAIGSRLGLERFGAAGEEFDPNLHEALATDTSGQYPPMTVVEVYQCGYRYAGRVMRAAMVVVSEHDESAGS